MSNGIAFVMTLKHMYLVGTSIGKMGSYSSCSKWCGFAFFATLMRTARNVIIFAIWTNTEEEYDI